MTVHLHTERWVLAHVFESLRLRIQNKIIITFFLSPSLPACRYGGGCVSAVLQSLAVFSRQNGRDP